MHYATPGGVWLSFELSVTLHNIAGITLSILYAFFIVMSVVSGNIRQYFPQLRGMKDRMVSQMRYYLFGIFVGAPHPTHATLEQKFNPLQQITYLQIMYGLVPIIIGTGWALLFPEAAPEKFLGRGGIWPVALLHTLAGFFGTLFMIGHIYLATTGSTPVANFRGMISGWHEDHSH